ncbi:unnamed protein product [Blepharisma stoltei]|uniref:Uncharacterized protein n=1 Tax=Blepharisma stoltei TaxID=1481888 RepID=A0AAU9JC11_9CILI|nr:unnamed protein product [Blepharisma stoltei]
MEDRTPLKGKLFKRILSFHEAMLVRRRIYKELKQKNLSEELEYDLYRSSIIALLSTFSAIYIFRKEGFLGKFLAGGLTFSISFTTLELFYEETFYYRLGLQDTPAGKIIRKIYFESLPGSKPIKAFRQKEKEYKEFNENFRYREDPMKKFMEYALKNDVINEIK